MKVYKYLFILIIVIFSNNSHSFEGVVKAHSAPVFIKQNTDSKIIDFLKKGTNVTIHKRSIINLDEGKLEDNQDSKVYDTPEEDVKNIVSQQYLIKDNSSTNKYKTSNPSSFYEILDNNGSSRFILKRHVFVFTNDAREFNNKKNDFDETNYLIAQSNLINFKDLLKEKYIASFDIGLSTFNSYQYPYLKQIKNIEKLPPINLIIELGKYFIIEKEQRLSLRLQLAFSTSNKTYIFQDFSKSREDLFQSSFGSNINYDFYQTQNYIYNIGLGININYLNNNITQTTTTLRETRSFGGFFINPSIRQSFLIRDALPNIDFKLTHLINLYSVFNFSSTDSITNKSLWQSQSDNDVFENKFSLNQSFYMGIISYH